MKPTCLLGAYTIILLCSFIITIYILLNNFSLLQSVWKVKNVDWLLLTATLPVEVVNENKKELRKL